MVTSKASLQEGSTMKKRRQRGTGTLQEYRHTDGTVSFRCQYRDASGRQVKQTIGRTSEIAPDGQPWTRRKAEDELRARINRVKKEGYRRPRPVVFREFAWRWFNESQRPRNWKPTTIITYRVAVKRLNERFGRMQLGKIERSQINSYVAQLLNEGVAARTVNLTLTVLHSILDKAVDEGLIHVNPSNGVRRPNQPDYTPRYLTVEEARAVEAKIPDPFVRLAFVTAEIMGLRFSELRNLKWRDVDLLARRLRVATSKTPTGVRSAAIPAPLVGEFEKHFQRSQYKAETDWVFHQPHKGTKFNPEHYRKLVKDAAKAVGITEKFRPFHDMRVTSATSSILTNEHPTKTMMRHGWSSYETFKRYQQLTGQVFEEEAEALAAFRLGQPAEAEAHS
jgi:integrase/recombinase XerC